MFDRSSTPTILNESLVIGTEAFEASKVKL